jgi:hypothetical protein
LEAAAHLQVQMVQIQFLDQLHQLVVGVLLGVEHITEILEVPEAVVAGAQLELPDWVVLELPIKDIGVATEKLITQLIELVAGVVALAQRLLTYLQIRQPQVVSV